MRKGKSFRNEKAECVLREAQDEQGGARRGMAETEKEDSDGMSHDNYIWKGTWEGEEDYDRKWKGRERRYGREN